MTTKAIVTVQCEVEHAEVFIFPESRAAYLSFGSAATVTVRSGNHPLSAIELATLLRHLANDLDRLHQAQPELDLVRGDGRPV